MIGMAVAVKPQKRNTAVDRRNRKALDEIDNLPTVVISLNFRGQLLANVQVAAANENSEMQVCVTVNGVTSVLDKHVTKRAAAPKGMQKKAVKVNSKPEEVIAICLDTVEGLVEKVNLERKKAASGLTNKPKEVILDVDAKKAAKHSAPVEYVHDMYKFYKLVEVMQNEKRPHDYTNFQHEKDANMRAMVGVRSKSEWTVFLVRFIKIAIPVEQMEYLVFLLAELGVMDYGMLMYSSSLTAVHAAKFTLNKTPAWCDTSELQSGLSEFQLIDWPKILVRLHAKAPQIKLQGRPSTAVHAAKCPLNNSSAWCDTFELQSGFSESQLFDCVKTW